MEEEQLDGSIVTIEQETVLYALFG